jgi:tetratricopeptide (TPR) repeat protein
LGELRENAQLILALMTILPVFKKEKNTMLPVLPIAILAGGAGLGLTLWVTAESPTAPEPRFFDPVLSDGVGLCGPDDKGRPLLDYYRKVAAKTETSPFTPPAGGNQSQAAAADAPLYRNLGKLTFPVTTANPMAQRYFDQGLRLAYGFNHAEALRAFRTALKHDPNCAMCAWGEALVLGPNINAPMQESAVAPAMAAVRKATEKAGAATPQEQALIAALAKRYADDAKAERAPLDAAYAAAMGEAAARFPQLDDIQALYAEALMDLTPWDYWETGGTTPKGKTAEIVRVLEQVLKRNPDHPGAIHFYIHTMEASAAPEKAVPYAKRLAAAMPGAGHLVHMPFHIYYRIGDYKAALAANKAAVAVDEAYLAQAAPKGIYPAAYYPHNVHSLMASAQMAGDGKAAVAAAEKLARVVTGDAARAIPWVQPIKAASYFAHAQFSTPRTILGLSNPGDDLPFVQAMWHYARGVAYATQKDIAAAQGEAEAIARIKSGTDFAALVAVGVPVPDVLELARQVVLGRIALAEDKLEAARAAFEQAVALQDRLPYSEPPHWYYPVRQSLGAVLVRLNRLDAAEEVFRASLMRAPNNGWALYGLTEVYRQNGRKDAFADVKRRLDRAWAGDRRRLDLVRL